MNIGLGCIRLSTRPDRGDAHGIAVAALMEHTPAAIRKKTYINHNFDQIGFRPMTAGDPANLDWLMEDYVEHFKHHLRQIDALLPS